MGGVSSTMKVEDGSSKEVASITERRATACSSNKTPSTSTTTVVIGEEQVCSTYQVRDGETPPQMQMVSVFDPAPSDEEIQLAVSLIKDNSEAQISAISSSDLDTKQLADLKAAIALCCNPKTCPPPVMKMIARTVKDETVWDAFRKSEAVSEFMELVANHIPQLSQTPVVNRLVDGNPVLRLDKNRILSLIFDKARENVLGFVTKGFDGLENVFIGGHEQPPHQKTKQSFCAFKYPPEERSSSEENIDTLEYIVRITYLATKVISMMVYLSRVINLILKS